MTNQEFKDLLSKSKEKKAWNEFTVQLDFPHIGFQKKFTGVTDLYAFLLQQVNGWEKIKKETLPKEFLRSIEYFTELKKAIIQNVQTELDSYRSRYRFDDLKSKFQNNRETIFCFDSPEVAFLTSLHAKHPKYFSGAYHFIIDQFDDYENNKDFEIGKMLAYEYYAPDLSSIASRYKAESKSMEQLREDFQQLISDASEQVKSQLETSQKDISTKLKAQDKLKDDKKKEIESWFLEVKENISTYERESNKRFTSFESDSHEKIANLEKLYNDKLMLEAPASYWEDRAKVLRKKGNNNLKALIVCSLIGIVLLFSLLWSIANGSFDDLYNQAPSAIRWSIVFVVFIALLAFVIRLFAKLMFSSYHLARDAEERKHLSFAYLAMRENGSIGDAERNIILQSIFSRADTGLLKEDSSPTMPLAVVEKMAKSQ